MYVVFDKILELEEEPLYLDESDAGEEEDLQETTKEEKNNPQTEDLAKRWHQPQELSLDNLRLALLLAFTVLLLELIRTVPRFVVRALLLRFISVRALSPPFTEALQIPLTKDAKEIEIPQSLEGARFRRLALPPIELATTFGSNSMCSLPWENGRGTKCKDLESLRVRREGASLKVFREMGEVLEGESSTGYVVLREVRECEMMEIVEEERWILAGPVESTDGSAAVSSSGESEWEVGMLENEVSSIRGIRIRRRPPSGPPLHYVGPFQFRLQNAGNRPRNILEEIVWNKDKEVSQLKERKPLSVLKKALENAPPARDFIGALRAANEQIGLPGLIAEVKKASLSRGILRENFDPVSFMASEKYDVLFIRLNEKNYSAWAFQFHIFVTGKDLWGYVDGITAAPDKDKDKVAHAKWAVKDAQFRGFEHCPESSSLQDCNTMWSYLQKFYSQNNAARRFQLEHNIANFKQDSLSISDFYSQFMNLWDEYTDIVYANLPSEGFSSLQTIHDITKRDQFLMKLRYDFEGIRSNLMHRDPVPSLDACLNELLCEEQRLLTQSIIEDQRLSTVPVAYVAQGKSRRHDMSTIQCFSCKRFDHYASTCPKKFCNYCKEDAPVHPNATTDAPTLTPEMVQQMIISAFSALGLSGNSSSPWYFDSGLPTT
ncbi:hypothetical protein V8G54_023919 [Vigna mungo]|uniref:indole-3-glycerol-phosphate synthase n=1 Tax=Vigna mungo TaxID=3915 RepID=A0AAQ3N4P6_VIGMU